MADNPSLKYKDRLTVNFSDPQEKTSFMDELKKIFPTTAVTVLHSRLAECREKLKPSESREQLLECMRQSIR